MFLGALVSGPRLSSGGYAITLFRIATSVLARCAVEPGASQRLSSLLGGGCDVGVERHRETSPRTANRSGHATHARWLPRLVALSKPPPTMMLPSTIPSPTTGPEDKSAAL